MTTEERSFELLERYMKYYINCLIVCYNPENATSEYHYNEDGSTSFIGSNSYLRFGKQMITSFDDWKEIKINKYYLEI